MYTICKQYSFSAAHQLKGLPEDHPCARLHGHNYKVELTLTSDDLDEVGFVIDFAELDKFYETVVKKFGHKFLNDELPFNPTAENLAKYIYHEARVYFYEKFSFPYPAVKSVKVWETEKAWAMYEINELPPITEEDIYGTD